MDENARLRVYNRTKYDIGVTLLSGQQPNIIAGGFIKISADDICFIDGSTRSKKPFSSRELVVVGNDGKEISLEELGGYTDPKTVKHLDNTEIESNLKKSANQIKKWLEGIDDPVELDSIKTVAESMDLPKSKLNVIDAKINGDSIGE